MPERPHVGESRPGEFDCLNLNVTLPAGTKPKDRLPVMIWFHGGGFVFGTANYSVLDVANISSDIGCPTIFVTVNYRLGFLGFLASDDIKEDSAKFGGGNGNQAIR
jgi:carboxylesterase type B